MIQNIVSGGQSGADLLAIDWAVKNDIECELNVERNYLPLSNGIIPTGVPIHVVSELRGYSGGWIERRKYNILHSDFTLIFVRKDIYKTRGSLGTMTDCKRFGKPFVYIKLSIVDSIDIGIGINLLENHNVKVLNVAGERTLNSAERKKMIKFLDMLVLEKPIDNFD